MSYVEYLVCCVLVASAIIGGALFAVGWLIAKLIENGWEIGGNGRD